MRWLRHLGSLLRRRAHEDRLDEEVQFHLEMRRRENAEAGMSPEEADRAARIGARLTF